MVRFLPFILVLFACKGEPESGRDYTPPSIVTDALESGITGESYAQWLVADGGESPLRWEIVGDLPSGLVFNPAGAISGVPTQPDDVRVTVTVTDERGKSDSAEMSLAVALALNAVPCGITVEGEFSSSASIDWYEVDWSDDEGYTWLQIPLPEDDTTRIELSLAGFGAYFEVYLAVPGTPVGDQDLDANYSLYYGGLGSPTTIDLGTYNDLPTYQSFGDAINLLVVPTQPGEWSAWTDCSNGPIFEGLVFLPTLLGDELWVNFDIVGNDDGARFWTDDTLPDWVEWDEETGRLTGTTADIGSFEFDVKVEDADGKTRTERAGFGVYEIEVLGCDESYQWTPSVAYYDRDGMFSNFYNVASYKVFQLDSDPAYSVVTAHLDGFGGGEVGFAAIDGWRFYISGPSDGDWAGSNFAASLSAQSWPSLSEYNDLQGYLNAIGFSYFGSNDEATFWFECDPAPRPDVQALPVLDSAETEAWNFDVLGGTPPYTWSSVDLPAGVTLDATGLFSSDQPVEGEYAVTLSVLDDDGLSGEVDYTLFVGDEAACLGHPRLSCGDANNGTFTDAYYESISGGTAFFCMDSDTSLYESVVVTLTSVVDAVAFVALTNPGRDPFDAMLDSDFSVLAWAGSEEIDVGVLDHSTGLGGYDNQVLFLTVAGLEPGDWSMEIVCN
jgi:hypothetical protein